MAGGLKHACMDKWVSAIQLGKFHVYLAFCPVGGRRFRDIEVFGVQALHPGA